MTTTAYIDPSFVHVVRPHTVDAKYPATVCGRRVTRTGRVKYTIVSADTHPPTCIWCVDDPTKN
jgi:hypothetical protein